MYAAAAMWVVVHVYVGLAIAALVKEPVWLVAVLAFGSHVPLDLIPHWGYTISGHPIAWGWVDFIAGCATLLLAMLVRLSLRASAPRCGAKKTSGRVLLLTETQRRSSLHRYGSVAGL